MNMSKLDSKIFEITEDRAEGEGCGEDEDGEPLEPWSEIDS